MNTLLILALVAGAQSGTISRNREETCATSCTASSNKFGYEAGHTYEFRYGADTVTKLAGAAQEHSSLHITATVNVEVLSACEHVLVIKDVTLDDSEPRNLDQRQRAPNHDEFRSALERRPLRFSFQDGRVDRLCSHQDEPSWVMNVKRGVLSTFQNTMESLEKDHQVSETDVAGKCQAEYKISGSGWNSVTIKKSKNLLGCTHRQGGLSAVQATPYTLPSEIQSLPLLKSTHECEQKVKKGGHLESTKCEETHVFRPFSNENSGASTQTTQTLTFTRDHSFTSSSNRDGFSKHSSLLFEHTPEDLQSARDTTMAEAILTELCSTSDVRPSTPAKFTELVYTLKRLNTAAMHNLHRKIHSNKVCEHAHKFFEDAIPMVGSSASVSFMKELMSREKVDADRVAVWMSSLAFINRPDAEMIREARGLLDLKNQEQVILPVSALVNSYCRHNTNCGTEADVGDIVRILRENLGISCRTTTATEKRKMMKSMKAIGNIPVSNSASDVLKRCYTDYKNPTDVRVAAIDAMRRMPCDVQREDMMEILSDADHDSELRISAYMGLMKCPSSQLIAQLKALLEREEVNQVGSFIWTHFTNLQTTGDAFKKDISAILKDQKLAKEFDMDKRKFSRNYEKSFFMHSFNVGGKAEGNLIWSQKSFIPRAGNLNLTVDVFGQSINLLEFGGRVEGLDRLLENLLGPDGYFKKGPKKESRDKRSVSGLGQLDRLHKKYALKPEDDLQGSAYMRMFGNDLAYMDLKDLKTKKGQEFNILEFLIKLAQDHKYDVSRSYMFLDSTLTVPTAAGLPLKLAVNGTATVRLQVEGKMDMRKLGTTPRSVDIDGSIKPSGAIEISSMMSVDAYHARTGLRMVTSLHSSSGVDGKLKIEESQIVTAQLNWPKDKIEIFNLKSEFFVMHRERPVSQAVMPGRQMDKKMCSGNRLQKTLGLQLCGEIKVAKAATDSPLFPLTGPASASITLQKTDTHNSYEFDARMLAKKDRKTKTKTYHARVAFNTPGSQVDRELLTEFILDTKDKDVKFEVRTPWKKVAVGGSVTYTDNIKRLQARVMLDETQEMSLLSEVQMDSTPRKITISPKLEVKAPWFKPWTINGKAEAIYGKEYTTEVSANIMNKAGSFKGSVEVGRNGHYDTNLQLNTPAGNAKLSGFLDKRRISSRTRVMVSYNFLSNRMHKFTFSGKTKAISKGLQAKYQANGALQSSQFPQANFEIDVNAGKTKRVWDQAVEIRFGEDMKDTNKRIFFKSLIRRGTKGNSFSLDQNAKLLFKLYNINIATKLAHKHSPTSVKSQAVINYSPTKEINLNVDLSRKADEPIHYNGDISLSYPGRELRITDTLEERAGNYRHQMMLQWQKKRQITINTNYKPNGLRHDVRTEIKYPRGFNFQDAIVSGTVVLDPKDFQGKLELLHGNDNYASTVNYNIANTAGKGNLDIVYPGRHIVASVTGAKKGGSYDGRLITRWDADGDKSKKMIVDGRFTTDVKNLEGHVKVSHPSRVLRAMFDQKKTGRRYSSHAEVSWEKGQKIALDTDITNRNIGRSNRFDGTVRFISPFERFELLKLHAGHKDDGLSMNTEGDFSWAPGKTLSIKNAIKRNRKWSNADITTTIKTPFDDAEEIKAQTTYKVTSDDIATTFVGEMNKHKIEVEGKGQALLYKVKKDVQGSLSVKTTFDKVKDAAVKTTYKYTRQGVEATAEGTLNGKSVSVTMKGADKGTRDTRNMESAVQVTTPFENFEKMELNTRHVDNGKEFTTRVQGKLQEKEITAVVNMNHEGSGLEFKHRGNFELKTPFRQARTIGASWNAENDNGKATSHVEVEHNGEKLNFNMETRHKSGSFGRRVTTKVMLKPMYSSTRFNSNINMKHNRKGAEASFMFARNGKKDIDFTAALNKEDMTNFDVKVEMKSGFEQFEDVSALVSLKASAQPATTHAEFKWTKDDKVTIDSDWMSVSGRCKGNMQISTPFQNYEKTVFRGEYLKASDKHTVSSHIIYGQNKKLELKSSYETGKGSFEFNSACPWFKSLTGEYELTGSLGDFKNSMRLVYVGKERAFFESSLEHDDSKTSGNFHLQSPSEMLSDIKYTFTNLRSSDYQTSFKLDINNKHTVEGTSTNKIGTGKFSHSSQMTSTFENFKKLVTKIDNEYNSYGYTSKFSTEAQVAGEMTKGEFLVDAKYYGKKSFTYSSSLTSSWFTDVSSTASISIDRNTYASNVEVKYEPAKVISFNGFVNTDRKVRGQMKLQTPFEMIPSLEANFEHNGELKNFKTDGEIDYSPWNGKIEGRVAFRLRGNDVSGRINVKSPFGGYERASAELKHTTRRNTYDTTVLATFGRQRVNIQSDLKVPSTRHIEGTLLTTTSFDVLRNMKVTVNHRCGSDNMNTQFEYQRNGRPKTELQMTFNKQAGYSGKATFQSPIKGAEFLELAFNHRGDSYQFIESHAEVSYSRSDKIETDFTFRVSPDFRSTFTFKTPFTEDVELQVTHSGNSQAFRCHAEYTRGGEKRIQGDLDAVLTRPEMTLRATVKTPFKYAKEISYTATSTVTEESVRSTAELSYYHGKIVKVVNLEMYDGTVNRVFVNLKTPYCKDIEGEVAHSVRNNKITTSIQGKYDNLKKVDYSHELILKPRISGTMSLSTAYDMPDIKASFNHAGQATDFKTSGKVILDQTKTYSADVSFSYDRTLEADLQVTTPQYSTITANVKNQLTKRRLNTDIAVSYDGKKIEVDSKIRFKPNVDVTVSVKTPFEKYQDNLVTMKLDYDSNAINGNARFTQMNSIKFSTGLKASTSPMALDFNLMMPILELAPFTLSLKSQGEPKNFRFDGEMDHGMGKLTTTASFKIAESIEGSFELNTPYTKVGKIELSFNHEGSLASFTNSANLNIPTGKFAYNGRFNSGNKISGSFQITTPDKQLDEVQISFDHAGTLMNFRNMLTITAPCGKTTYTGSFSKAESIEGSFKLISPLKTHNSISLTFNHEGGFKSFRNAVSFATPVTKFGYKGNFDQSPVKGDFIVTAGDRKWEVKFGQTGEFRGYAKISTDDEQQISLTGDVQVSPQVTAAFGLETPFPYMEKWSANYNQELDRNTKTFHAEVTYQDKAASADVEFKNQGKDLSVRIATPFEKFESVTYIGKIEGDLEEFKTQHVLNSHLGEISLSGEFDKWPLEATVSLKTPFKYMEDINTGIKYNNDGNTRKAHGEASYKTNKVALDVEQVAKTIKVMFTSPFENFEDITYNGGVEGRLKDFKFTSDLTYVHGKIEVSGEFDVKPVITKVVVKTPYDGYDRMALNLKVNPKQKMGNLAVIIPFGKFRINGQLEKETAKLLIQSPFKVLKELTASATTKSDGRKISANLEIDRNDEKEIHLDASLENGVKQVVKADFDSKYTEKAALEGSLKAANGEIDYNAKATYGSKSIFDTSIIANFKSMKDVVVTFNLDTAYKHLKDVQLVTEHKIEGYNVVTKVDVRYAPTKHIKTSLQYTHGDTKEGTITLETPFEDYSEMTLTFSHKGTWKRCECDAAISFLGDQIVKAHYAFTLARQTNGELTIENPFKNVKLMFNHEGDLSNFENSASLNWGPTIEASSKYSYNARKISGGFSLATPFINARQFSGSFNHEGSMSSFTNKVEVSYAPGKVIKTETTFANGIKKTGTVTLITPFKKLDRVSANFEHEGSMTDFTTTATATLPRRKVINGKIVFSTGSKTYLSATLTTPFAPVEDIGFSINHKGGLKRFDNKVQVQLSRDETIKAETTFATGERTTGTFALKTPFKKVGDVNAMFRHEGGLKDFSNVAEVEVARRNYKAESKFSCNERSTSGSMGLKSPANEMTMQFSHEGNLKRFSNSAALKINSKSFSAQSSFTYGYRTIGNIAVNTPWRAVSASLDHEGMSRQFRTTTEVKYGPSETIRTVVNFMNRQGRTSADFTLNTPFKQVNDVSAKFAHSGNARKFTTVVSTTYAGKTLQSNTDFSHSSGATRVTYKLRTPFEQLKNLDVSATRDGSLNNFKVFASVSHNEANIFSVDGQHMNDGITDFRCSGIIRTTLENLRELSASINHHHMGTTEVSSSGNVAYNGKTVFGAVVKHNKKRDGAEGSITMSYPSTFSYEYDIKNTNKELSGKVSVNKEYHVIFSKVDTSTYSVEKLAIDLKTVLPSRTMEIKGEMESSATRFVKTGSFSWDAARRRQIAYSLEMENNSRRYQKAYTAKARLDTPLRSLEVDLAHNTDSATCISTGSMKWDVARDASKAVTIKNVYEKTGTVCKNKLSLRAPGMDEDLTLSGEVTVNHGATIFMTKGSIDYNRNPTDILSFNIRVSDESTSSAHNYSLNFDLTHPRSTIDVHGMAHAANYPSKASTGLDLRYLTATRKTKTALLLAEIQKVRKQINLKMETPLKTMNLQGQVTEARGSYMGLATAAADGKSVKALFKLDTRKQSINFKTNYNPENSRDEFVITGRYKSMTELEGEASHTVSGRKTTDALLDMDLKNKHLLHTRVYWRPSMYFDIKYGGKQLLKDAKAEAASMWESFSEHAQEEARLKSTLISRATPSMDAFFEAMVVEGRSLLDNADDVIEAWNRMVRNNEFFLKDIKEATSEAVRYLDQKIRQISGIAIEIVARALLVINEMYEDVMTKLSEIKVAAFKVMAKTMRKGFRKMVYAYNSFARMVTKASDWAETVVAEVQAEIIKLAKKAAIKAQELNAVAMEKLAVWWQAAVLRAQPFMDATSVMYQNAVQKITTHPAYVHAQRKVIFFKNKMAAKVSDVKRQLAKVDLTKPVRDLHFNVKDKLTKAMAYLKKYTEKVSKKFNQAYNYVENKAETAVETLIAREHFKLVKTILNEVYHKATWAYEHYQVETRIKQGVSNAMALGFRFVKKNVMYIAIEYLKLDKDRIIVYDPSKAELEFEVYIPLEWPHLQTLPAVNVARTLANAKEHVSKYIPMDYSPWDTYYKYKPSKNPADWIPPFKAIASLSGDQHYMTFDRRFFSFAGTCSYVLARDMVDGDFSVVVNYQGNRRSATRKSLTVVINGKQVELVKNYRVKVDGKLANLPIKFQDTTIIRQGNTITLTNTKGFEVQCDFNSERCTMEISGWYFGKTAGLFGVYNNEPSDDFTTAERTKVTDAAQFAKSWLVSKSCRIDANVASTQEPNEFSTHTKMCAELFRSTSSPYRKCFKQVTPTPFFRMCVNTENKGLCRAASLYVRHCRHDGVSLQMPKSCRRCDTMGEGETKTIDEAPKSADIVFVVEENACNNKVGSKLAGIARNIELSLKDKLMKNNRYGIVGFGGTTTNEPFMHSIEGEFLANIRDFRGVQLTFEDGTNKDDVSAIQAATRYPFRPGVSKVIVLITCGTCGSSNYQQVKDTLTSQGFQLHVMREHELEMKDNIKTPKTNYLFGVDKDTAFTKNSGKRLASDKALHSALRLPDNQCFDLAVATKGSYFNLAKLNSGRRVTQKSYMHVFGMRVAQTAPPSACSTCECVTDTYGSTRTVCKPCHSTPMTPLEPSRPQLLGRPGEEPERFRPKPIAQPATFDLDYEESQ